MIGIIGAMPCEVDQILTWCEEKKEVNDAKRQFIEAKAFGKDIVIALSGVGKVNAAMTACIMCERYELDYLINIGVAGGLRADLKVLDIVISDQVIQHDFDTSFLDGEAGIGLISQSDVQLRKVVAEVMERLEYPFVVGDIASGDQFIADESQIKKILQHFPEAVAAEMEAGAIAQVAQSYQVPFVVLRSLSDVAFQEDSHLDFEKYKEIASERSSNFTKALIQSL